MDHAYAEKPAIKTHTHCGTEPPFPLLLLAHPMFVLGVFLVIGLLACAVQRSRQPAPRR